MTRQAAFALASTLADHGYSCTTAIGIHPTMSPAEHATVHVTLTPATRLVAAKLTELAEIGERHGCELALIGLDLRYIETARP